MESTPVHPLAQTVAGIRARRGVEPSDPRAVEAHLRRTGVIFDRPPAWVLQSDQAPVIR